MHVAFLYAIGTLALSGKMSVSLDFLFPWGSSAADPTHHLSINPICLV